MGKSVSAGFAWTAIDRFSNLFIQFVLGIIIARLITPAEYGVLGILMVFVNISQVFIDSGLSSALIYKNRIDRDYLDTSFVFNLVVSLILFAIIFLSSPFVEDFFSLPHLADYLRVTSFVLITNSLVVVPTSILKIKLDFRLLAITNITSSVISGLIGIVAAYLGYGVWALIIQLLSKSIVQLVILYFVCWWLPKISFRKKIFVELYLYGVNIFSASCLTKILDEGTSFLIGKVLTPFNLGVYARGSQFSSLPGNAIGGIISSALFPSLSSIKDDDKRFNEIYHRVIEIQSLLCIPTFVWLALMADPLVRLLITDKWIAVVPVIQILCIGKLLIPAAYVTEQVMNAKGRSDLFLRQQVWKMAIKTILVVGCLPFGLIAVVLAEAVYTSMQFFITNYFAHDVSDFKESTQLKVMIPYIFFSLSVGVITFLLMSLFDTVFIKLLIGTTVFFSLYCSFLIIFGKKAILFSLIYHKVKACLTSS